MNSMNPYIHLYAFYRPKSSLNSENSDIPCKQFSSINFTRIFYPNLAVRALDGKKFDNT